MSFITMCIHCYKFERRLCWLLSSIIQQNDPVDMTIDIAVLKGATTDPSIDNVVSHFSRGGLSLSISEFDKDIFCKRGLTRNYQIAKYTSPWYFFADADNVYHPEFFKGLVVYLKGKGKSITRCIASIHKDHTETEATNELISSLEYPLTIPNVYKKSLTLPTIEKINRKLAAGCMQVASKVAIDTKSKGLYVLEHKCRDSDLFNNGQMARSDIQFRRALGKSKLITLPKQIHLNHYRDKEATVTHLECQR